MPGSSITWAWCASIPRRLGNLRIIPDRTRCVADRPSRTLRASSTTISHDPSNMRGCGAPRASTGSRLVPLTLSLTATSSNCTVDCVPDAERRKVALTPVTNVHVSFEKPQTCGADSLRLGHDDVVKARPCTERREPVRALSVTIVIGFEKQTPVDVRAQRVPMASSRSVYQVPRLTVRGRCRERRWAVHLLAQRYRVCLRTVT